MGLKGPNGRWISPKDRKARPRKPRVKPGLSRYERVVEFIEKLPITSGPFAGTKFILRDWQREILEGIYKTDEHGKRIVRTALISTARKNGKTQLAAALALCHFVGPEAETRGQVYSAAADRNQAALIFREMLAIIRRTPWLEKRIIVRSF